MGNKLSVTLSKKRTDGNIPSFKIAFIGSSGTGKSSVLLRYVKNQFCQCYLPTLRPQIVNVTKQVNVPEHTLVSLTFWDIPGSETLEISQSYYTNLDAAIVVVDLSDSSSIEDASSWRRDVLEKLSYSQPSVNAARGKAAVPPLDILENDIQNVENFPIVLLGNKFDKVYEDIQFFQTTEKPIIGTYTDTELEGQDSTERNEKPTCLKFMERMAAKHQFTTCVAVSAKENNGSVESAMTYLVRRLLENRKEQIKLHQHRTHLSAYAS